MTEAIRTADLSLTGDDGNDEIHGGAGDDTLDGWSGNDIVYGGRGADTFAFAPGDGHDRITDFGEGDTIETVGVPGGFAALDIRQDGAGTVIHYGNGDTIRLSGVQKGDIETWHFEGDGFSQTGTDGDDVLNAGEGDDWLRGGDGNDRLYGEGGDGRDTLKGDRETTGCGATTVTICWMGARVEMSLWAALAATR